MELAQQDHGVATVRDDITFVLHALGNGAPGAKARLLELIYGELKRLASRKMHGQPVGHTLEPTALVHEAYLRLMGEKDPRWNDRSHFFAAAASAMRSILVDHARAKQAQKRGGGLEPVALNDDIDGTEELSNQILEVHEILDRLTALDARKGKVVELLFFGGLTVDECAGVLQVSGRTVKRDWRFARAWLFKEIHGA